jgi:hypothetical protein
MPPPAGAYQKHRAWDLATIGPFGGLPPPSGRGEIPCGNEALRRIHDLATTALQDSDAAGTVEPHKVFRALERLVSEHFIRDQHPPNQEQIMLALACVSAAFSIDGLTAKRGAIAPAFAACRRPGPLPLAEGRATGLTGLQRTRLSDAIRLDLRPNG